MMTQIDKKHPNVIKVLWVVLVKFPPLCEYLGEKVQYNCGWLYSAAKRLMHDNDEIILGFAIPTNAKEIKHYCVNEIDYYLIPTKDIAQITHYQIDCCKHVIDDFEPSLIHIHGSEHSLAAAFSLANKGVIRTLVNIQGLATAYIPYADGGLSIWQKMFITPLDIYAGTFSFRRKNLFKKRGVIEKLVFRHATDVVGRTYWDKVHSLSLNGKLTYHFLNETLRDSFYDGKIWNQKSCIKGEIFVSNSIEPLKGAHMVIKALPFILKVHPNAHLTIVGTDVNKKGIKQFLRFTGYQLYLKYLLCKYRLESKVCFVGFLSELEMRDQFLKANVYVLPSSIENSPNSLCEAQMLGVPAISAFIGGTPTLVKEGITGYLYRYNDVKYLASLICDVLSNDDCRELSKNEIMEARIRHDKDTNADRLMEIYNIILS